jgi:eukaryotic-like serine/threonine-protein kinase
MQSETGRPAREPAPRYEIHELLGIGGRGQVYRARDVLLDRWVALKLLRGGDEDVQQRLLREARAQARVDHPNVCRVFEAGELDGKPFIAMELVEGEPIDRATADLSLRQRIDLLRKVAEAVQAAHSQGLVHRDLKPGNVLVELRGDRLEPFVVDFGLAVEPEAPGLTATGTVVGTPGYMAPEQITGDRSRIDRRTDVYALGALLYRVLAGRDPYEAGSPVEALMEAVRTDPVPLRKVIDDVPRDLALIVHKCLERDPESRYDSARLLAEDLERFLDGRPVLAQPPSWTYRAVRVLRRHRRLAAGLGAAALLAVAGAVKYTVDLRIERAAAEAARDEAEEVSAFLVSLLEGVSPAEARGREVPVRELVDRAAARIDGDLAGRPATRTRIMNVLGSLYTRLGDFDRAEALLLDALALRKGDEPADGPARAALLSAVAELRYWQGDYGEARRHYEEGLAVPRPPGEAGAARAHALHGVAMVAIEEGEVEEARALLEEAVALRSAEDPVRPLTLSSVIAELGRAEQLAGDLERAREHMEESLRLVEPYGPLHPARSMTLDNLAKVYHDLGDLDRARAAMEEALAIDRRVLGERHHLVGLSVGNLARTHRTAGRYAEAETAYREALEIYREALGPDHQWVGITLGNLGKLHRDLGRYAEAREELAEAEEVLVEAVGEDAPTTGVVWFQRAWLELDLGAEERAEELFRRALEVFRRGGERHPNVGIGLEALGTLHLAAGRPEQALENLSLGLSIQEEGFGADDARAARCRARLALALVEAGRASEARPLAERSLRDMEAQVRERPQELPAVRGLAHALQARARAAESRESREEAYRRLAELLGERERLREVVELEGLYAEAVAGGAPGSHG